MGKNSDTGTKNSKNGSTVLSVQIQIKKQNKKIITRIRDSSKDKQPYFSKPRDMRLEGLVIPQSFLKSAIYSQIDDCLNLVFFGNKKITILNINSEANIILSYEADNSEILAGFTMEFFDNSQKKRYLKYDRKIGEHLRFVTAHCSAYDCSQHSPCAGCRQNSEDIISLSTFDKKIYVWADFKEIISTTRSAIFFASSDQHRYQINNIKDKKYKNKKKEFTLRCGSIKMRHGNCRCSDNPEGGGCDNSSYLQFTSFGKNAFGCEGCFFSKVQVNFVDTSSQDYQLGKYKNRKWHNWDEISEQNKMYVDSASCYEWLDFAEMCIQRVLTNKQNGIAFPDFLVIFTK